MPHSSAVRGLPIKPAGKIYNHTHVPRGKRLSEPVTAEEEEEETRVELKIGRLNGAVNSFQ